ncbi:hypothetical protein ACVBEF_01565 [Glaciimonas sp. GG7]
MNQHQPSPEFGLSLSFCSIWPLVGGLLSSAVPSVSNSTLKTALVALIAAANSVCEPLVSSAASERLAKFGLQISGDKAAFISSFSDDELEVLAKVQRGAQQTGVLSVFPNDAGACIV